MFERGFKTWCENYAVKKRIELGVKAKDPLRPIALAESLSIRVWTPDDVPGLQTHTKKILLRNDGKTPSCWSAVTLLVENKVVIILNSSHSPPRRASDLTHELAHIVLEHKAHDVDLPEGGMMLIANYDKKQEMEADWLSGCLLLPREALVHIKSKRIAHEVVVSDYGVSAAMLNYRMAMTGVNRQFA